MGFSVIKNGEILGKESLKRDIYAFSANLKARNLHCVEIYLSSSYEFMVAFFGAINAGTKAYILANEASLGLGAMIDDSNFGEFVDDFKSSNTDSYNDDIDSILTLICNDKAIDLPFFLYTSGSSKANGDIIPKTLRQMITEARILCESMAIKSDDIFIASIPHQYLYGLTFKIFLPLMANAMILDEWLNFPELILEYCAKNAKKSLILLTSPTLLKYLANQPNLHSLSTLKAIVSAGAKLDSAIRVHFRNAINIDIFEIYGSTESGVVAFNGNFSDKFIPFCGVRLKTTSDSRLIINSPWLQNALMSGDFISNDSARIENGALILQGRMDRIVKFLEKRINLDSLEANIKTLDIISDCFVGLVDGQNHAHCILVLSNKGKEAFLKSGKRGIIKAITTLKIKEIRHFHIRKQLPFNERGKITKKDFIACVSKKITPQFDIISIENNVLNARGYIDEGSFYFDGHFGDFPLIPGFVELEFVIKLAKKHLHLGDIFSIESVKFSSFMRPFSEASISIRSENNKLYFHIFSDKKECANGRIKPQY